MKAKMVEIVLGNVLTAEYLIPIFLATIFLASLLATKIKIPYTMILVGIGIAISVSHLAGVTSLNIRHFKVDRKLILYFIVPPLVYEEMILVAPSPFNHVRVYYLLLLYLL